MHDRSSLRASRSGTEQRSAAEPVVGKRTLTEQLEESYAEYSEAPTATTTAWATATPTVSPIQRAVRYNPFATHLAFTRAPDTSGGQAMPQTVQHKMESAFATSFSNVRIHQDASAEAMGARAYTRGTDVHFGPGEYQPTSTAGQELLGHELAHVVQQSQGRVQTTTQLRGVDLNDSSALETEAEHAGVKAARGERADIAGAGEHSQPAARPTAPVQRVIKIGEPVGLDQAQAIVQKANRDPMTEKLMRWYVAHLHADATTHTFEKEAGLVDDVHDFVDSWKKGLAALGLQGDTRSSGTDMYRAFRIYNADPPPNAEALVYKLDDKYKFLKDRWIAESGKKPSDHHFRGTIYDPPGGHTMPKNFAWIASVIHKQLPVRVVVPIDFRVLVREAVGDDLTAKLKPSGKQVVKGRKKMVEVNKEDVIRSIHPAPLSATAREILGFIGRDYYRVNRLRQTWTRNETELVPTGKALLNPQDVYVPELMEYDKLVALLHDRGVEVVSDDLVTRLHAHLKQVEEEQAADQWFERFYWTTSAIAALASWAVAVYMGQWSEG